VLDTYFRDLGDAELWAPAGAVWVYSNLGAALVGLAAEEASGTPFAQLVAEQVLAPAAMHRATLDADEVLADGDFATGRSGIQRTSPDWGYFPTGYYGPMGGAWLTATDLVRWGQAHARADPAVLPASSWDAMHTPWATTKQAPDQQHGYHLFLDVWQGTTVWSHGGSAPGFQATFAVLPDHGIAIAALVNGETLYAPWLMHAAVDELVGSRPPSASATVRPAEEWDRYVGSYHDPHELGAVEVWRDGLGLRASVESLACEGALQAWSEDAFALDCGTVLLPLTFWPTDDGAGSAWVSSVYGIAAATGHSPG